MPLIFLSYFYISTTCQSDSDCPYYSLGCQKLANVSICQFHIQCNKIRGCVALNQEYKHEMYKQKGEFKNANIANSKLGNTTFLFNNIFSKDLQCFSDEQCFSKYCNLGACMSNIDDPISVCHIVEKKEDGGSLYGILYKDNKNGTDALDIVCKRGIFEKCTTFNDCITNDCVGFIYNMCMLDNEQLINILMFFVSVLLFAIVYVNLLICSLFIKKTFCSCNSYQKKYRKYDQYNPHLIKRNIEK